MTATPRRFGVSRRLSAGLIGLATLTVLTAGLALWGLDRVRLGFDRIIAEELGQLTVVSRLVQRTESIAVIAPRIALAANEPELRQHELEMQDQMEILAGSLRRLAETGFPPETVTGLRAHLSEMTTNLDRTAALVRRRIDRQQAEKRLIRDLRAALVDLDAMAPRLPADSALAALPGRLTGDLLPLMVESVAARVRVLEKRLRADLAPARADLAALPAPDAAAVAPLLDRIETAVTGPQGLLALRRGAAEDARLLKGRLRQNDVLMVRLVSGASNILAGIEQNIARDRDRFGARIDQGSLVLTVIIVLAVAGAGLVFLYVQRRVTRRLIALQKCMLGRARGEPTPIPRDGRDEITDMADSLGHFVTEIDSRERALADARDEADRANRAKGEFLANMSHEIRTPMNAVIGLANLALQGAEDARQRDYLVKIQGSANALLGIINDILDLSKIEAGKLTLEDLDFRLGDVFQDVGQLITHRAEEKGLEVVFAFAPDLPDRVRGDPLRLGQILTNLCSNAVKFTEVGEIVVRCDPVASDAKGITLQFSVRDTGAGLTPEQQEKLFTAFTQADASITRRHGGTGLGLAICKRLVARMGGRIWVKSAAGQGATFFFTARFGHAATPQAAAPRWPDLRGARVLVAEDNETTRLLLTEMLEHLDCRVTAVADGAAALAEIQRAETAGEPAYDIALMDWRMPHLDGLAASRRLKAGAAAHPPIVIMVTGFGRDAVLGEADARQAIDALLVKPIDPSVLFDTMMTLTTGGRVDFETIEAPNLAAMTDGEAGARVAGRRVLLVEDNEINQQVAREILEHWRIAVDLANNGEEALLTLAEVGANHYDAVLMDIQMPGMDGKEATRRIRADLGPDLPIVAMTAHAMDEERRACLDAGMNEHVAKPIDPATLFRVLAALWPDRPPGARAAPAPAPRASVPDLPASLPGIDTAAGLKRVMGNGALYRRLLIDFAARLPDQCATLKRQLQDQDWDPARESAHALKGVAGNIGATELAHIAQTIEKHLKTGAHDDALDALPRLTAAADTVGQGLATLSGPAAAAPAAAGAAAGAANAHALLDRLETLLADNDLDATGLVEAERATLNAALGPAAGDLANAVAALDFGGAREILARARQ